MIIPSLHTLLVTLVLGSTSLLAISPPLWTPAHRDPQRLQSYVGQVARKCCKPGRRWGCAPENFQQTGCVHIEQQYPNCYASRLYTMKCTAASCESAGSEDVCNIVLRTVALNQCRPLGTKTTVGCPPDHWQCAIEKLDYTRDGAPQRDVYVCNLDSSTICQFDYSMCD
jgi:hypothetical protein